MSIRVWSLGIPLVFVALGSFLFPGNTSYWTVLLLITVALGYVHFGVATVYQLKSYWRHPQKTKLFIWFGLLCSSTVIGCLFLILNGHTMPLGVVSIAYFVAHVLLNEQTFLSRALGFSVSYIALLSVSLLVLPLFISGLSHPSFFYDYSLQYPLLFADEYQKILGEYAVVSIASKIGLVLLIIYAVSIPLYVWRQYRSVGLVGASLASVTIVSGVVLFAPAVNFVFILHTVLVYHFILLSLLFFKPMQTRGRRSLYEYIGLHGAIIVPLCVLVFGYFVSIPSLSPLSAAVFNFQAFVLISVTHITVSFLNESWVRTMLHIRT